MRRLFSGLRPCLAGPFSIALVVGLCVLTLEGKAIAHQIQDSDARPSAAKASEPTASGQQPPPPQDHDHMHPDPDAAKQEQKKKPAQTPAQNAPDEHAGHNMQDMDQMAGMDHSAHSGHSMATVTGGPFNSMNAIGSGTALVPSSTPGYMWHWMLGHWALMLHANVIAGLNHQGGPRGINKAASENWAMFMAEDNVGVGRLMLRGMFSAEPATAPRGGFPELFQTGETFKGRPIIDAQHPHDLFMELAAQYTIPLSEQVSVFAYGGPVAEPALGPPAFMHRASASENPAAPLGHHWQDSTHITDGVVTLGVTAWRFRFEGSVLHAAEPDENRTNITPGKLDSWSGRVTFTPTPDWAIQFSHGHLVNLEVTEPGNVERTTASIIYNRKWSDGNWASSLIWGRNHENSGNSNAYLFESTVNFRDKNYLFTRLELVDKRALDQTNTFGRPGGPIVVLTPLGAGELLVPQFDQTNRIGAFTFGAVRDVVVDSRLRIGIGADITFYHLPDGLKPVYGSSPTSVQLFLRFRPGKMHM